MRWYRYLKGIYWKSATGSHILKQINPYRIKTLTFLPGLFSGIYVGSIYCNDKIRSMKGKLSIAPVVMATTEGIDSKNDNKKTKMFNFVADAVDIAAPSVVYIEVVAQNQGNLGKLSSTGSGFIVTEDGMVLTNAHVVNNAGQVDVKLATGETFQGLVVDVDEEADLAAIKLLTKNKVKFPHVKLGVSSKVRAGEWVAALGSPLRLSDTVTAGIVSSLHRASGELGMRHKDMVYIQTDAAINVGNSGGPLINLDGEVIGINCITVQQAAGISFAIPSDVANEFLEGAIKNEKYLNQGDVIPGRGRRNEKFYIGISMLTLTPAILQELQQRSPSHFGSVKSGVLVARVSSGSPSERCGLTAGDVIISINGKQVTSSRDVYSEVRKGDTIVMKVQRGKNTLTLKVEPEISSRL